MDRLLTKTYIEENYTLLPDWQQRAYQTFANTIADAHHRFPCIPGRQGFLTNQLRFCFLGSPALDETRLVLAEVLRNYGECSRTTGEYASLVVIFETAESGAFLESETAEVMASVEAYEAQFWSILSDLHALDERAWPNSIAPDPEHHTWEFVFDGEPYFAFCATPSHSARRSRFFPWFLIAFQPRFVFDQINDSTLLGQKLKTVIRKRLEAYDSAPVHPALKSYGQSDNHEWKQYFLRDDDTSPHKCPFLQHATAFQSNDHSMAMSFQCPPFSAQPSDSEDNCNE